MVVTSAVRSSTMSVAFLSEATSTIRWASSAGSSRAFGTRSARCVLLASGSPAIESLIEDQLLHRSRDKVADGATCCYPLTDLRCAHRQARTFQKMDAPGVLAEALIQPLGCRSWASRARADRPLRHGQDALRLPPGVDLRQRVDGHHQEEARALAVKTLQLLHAVDRVRRAWSLHLDGAQLKERIRSDRQARHQEPMDGGRHPSPSLVRRLSGRHEEDAIQRELVSRQGREPEVADVRRVERPAQDANPAWCARDGS